MKVITLTTDFGTQDWFVGTMKGVILDIHPRAQIVDITHEIAPGDIRAGAFSLMTSASYLPKDSIHVAIVDPGVGSERRAIAIKTKRAFFIGPDNGVLSWAIRGESAPQVRHITNARLFRHPVSRTFHGRDIFSPVAAHLASGKKFEHLGPEILNWNGLPWPEAVHARGCISGEILHLDRFGNAITNLPHDLLKEAQWARADVSIKSRKLGAPQSSYAAAKPGKPLAILSSSSFLEISVNCGSAQKLLKLKIGDVVKVRL